MRSNSRNTKNSESVLIFSFEGLDASGKNTQSNLLYESLLKKRIRCEHLSFPDYTTKIGEEIRAFLNGKREYGIETRHVLYSANRYEHIDRIKKWITERKAVIVNRYCESNIAYGVANGLSIEWLRSLESVMPQADYVFLLKINPEVSSERKPKRDRFEADIEYLRRVSNVYLTLAESRNWIVIDGNRTVSDIHSEISKLAAALMSEGPLDRNK
jgi:dTMP kinase